MIGEGRLAIVLSIGRLPIDGLTIGDRRIADCPIADWIGDCLLANLQLASVDRRSSIVDRSIGNRHPVDRRPSIVDPSIGNRHPVGRRSSIVDPSIDNRHPVDRRSSIVDPSIGNRHPVDRRSSIVHSIAPLQSPIGSDVWAW
jgi:hypothetical protein